MRPSQSSVRHTRDRQVKLLVLLAVLAVHLVAIAGFAALYPVRSDRSKPVTVTLLTLVSTPPKSEVPLTLAPRQSAALTPPLLPMPEIVISAGPGATSSIGVTEDPCLRLFSEAERRDCELHLQLPGGMRLDESGNAVGAPAGAIRRAPEDEAEADRIAERLDLSLKARFGRPEAHENPADRERLPEIPVETWQKVEIRNRETLR